MTLKKNPICWKVAGWLVASLLAAADAQHRGNSAFRLSLRGSSDPLSPSTSDETIIYDADAATVKRSAVLHELGNLMEGTKLDTVEVMSGEDDMGRRHLMAYDLVATCPYNDMHTMAFNLTGHIIMENPVKKYHIICPAQAEGGSPDTVCTVHEEKDVVVTTDKDEKKTGSGGIMLSGDQSSLESSDKNTPHLIQEFDLQDCCNTCQCCMCEAIDVSCFSLESTVIVKHKGKVSIRDLQIGDMVLSDDYGGYSKFYSKGHYNENVPTNFLRIFTEFATKPLELTPGHMVFTASGALPVPAHSIKVGDVLKTATGPSKVTSVEQIERAGIFNPITMSGSIVVDGIVSSIHSEEPGFEGIDAGWIYLSGYKLIHWHRLMHWIHAPHRTIQGRFGAFAEKLNEDGFVPFHQFLAKLDGMVVAKQSTLFSAFILSATIAVSAFFLALELFLDPVTFMLVSICFMVGSWFAYGKLNVKVKRVKVV